MKSPGRRPHAYARSSPIVWLALLGVLGSLGLCEVKLQAQGTVATEYAVKAAFVGKFPQFVKWPSKTGPITVGILGDDPFGRALEGQFKVKRSKRIEELKGCQLIFISKSERGALGGILSGLAGLNILTVGESAGFAEQGGIIGFTMEGDKVRFEINLGAARRGGLGIDPQFVRLAVRVFES